MLVDCGYHAGCVGAICYCGTSYNPLLDMCSLSPPNGACMTEVEEAAGTTDIFDIFAQQADMSTAKTLAEAAKKAVEAASSTPTK